MASIVYVDFGGTRPGLVPAGTGGSTEDILVYENISAIVEKQRKTSQIFVIG